MDHDVSSLSLDAPDSIAYVLKALAAGVWAYFFAPSFEDGLQKIIMEGGDADTNGCISGSLLGLKYGYKNIPKPWIAGLDKRDLLGNYFEQYLILLENKEAK
jgi:ADP-ribosylglycohydrolase